RFKLYIVDKGANRDVFERQTIANFDFGFFRNHEGVAYFERLRRKNVALLAVSVIDEGNETGAVGIVFKAGDFCRNFKLVIRKINIAEKALMTTTMVASSDETSGTAGHALETRGKLLMRLACSQRL